MFQRSNPSFFIGNLKKVPTRPKLPDPNSQFSFSENTQITFGEVVESLKCFWYVSFQLPERNPDQDDASDEIPSNSEDEIWGLPMRDDWGIHVNSDCLFEKAAILAKKMEEEGIENPPLTALWLYFAFGFQHEYFHHVVDSQIAMHESRIKLDIRTEDSVCIDESGKKLRLEYLNLYDKYMVKKEGVDWWLFLEEALANASVVVETSQLSDLQHIFVHYGLLPTPGDVNFGAYSLWENAIDSDGWDILSSFVWLQHLQVSHDPFSLIDGLETIRKQKGKSSAFQKFCESLNGFHDFPMLSDLIKIKGTRGSIKNASFGSFNPQSDGILSRLEIPIIIHGSRKQDLLHHLENDWPHGAIENLYNAFSRTDTIQEDPFSEDDEDLEFVA